jgi:hypothetical protein
MSDLIEVLARAIDCTGPVHPAPGSYSWKRNRALATAALAALRETHHLVPKDQEPVGWLWIEKATGDRQLSFVRLHDNEFNRERWSVTPLYALEKRHD